jgi:hypothetical protein
MIERMDRAAQAARSAELLDWLARDLAATIRRTFAESPQIEQCLGRIQAAGYEVALSLEASLGFSRGERDPHDESGLDVRVERDDPPSIKMTPLDKKFLRSLKISVDDEE